VREGREGSAKKEAAAVPPHYSTLIEWSDEDQAYVVFLPEWEGCNLMPVASGKTYSEAFQRGLNTLEHLIEAA
jgi:antitoxin HicB